MFYIVEFCCCEYCLLVNVPSLEQVCKYGTCNLPKRTQVREVRVGSFVETLYVSVYVSIKYVLDVYSKSLLNTDTQIPVM